MLWACDWHCQKEERRLRTPRSLMLPQLLVTALYLAALTKYKAVNKELREHQASVSSDPSSHNASVALLSKLAKLVGLRAEKHLHLSKLLNYAVLNLSMWRG